MDPRHRRVSIAFADFTSAHLCVTLYCEQTTVVKVEGAQKSTGGGGAGEQSGENDGGSAAHAANGDDDDDDDDDDRCDLAVPRACRLRASMNDPQSTLRLRRCSQHTDTLAVPLRFAPPPSLLAQ